MKISAIEAYGIACVEPNDYNRTRYTTIVRVRTDEGVSGWGEGITMWPEATHAVVTLIEKGFKDLLIGEDPLQTEKLWHKMRSHVWWYGVGGLASFSVSALDMALWDIKGRALGLPVYQLMGGLVHEKLPAIASIHGKYATHEENVGEIASYIEEGYQGVKIGFGKKGQAILGREEAHDLEFVRRVRERIGYEKMFIIDIGNGIRWETPHAIRMARAYEEHRVLWLEEPFHPDRMDDYRELRQKTNIWIGAGEREWHPEGYRRLLESGTVDVFGIDPARAEGITGFLKIRELIGSKGKIFNAHAWSTGITTAASLHLSVSSPHCLLLELKPLANPMQHELTVPAITHRDGWVFAPDAPGLGVEVDEAALRKYRLT